MPNTEIVALAIRVTTYNGTCTLTRDPRTEDYIWRNSNGGRVSAYYASLERALRSVPQ